MIRELLSKALRQVADRIDAGTCEMSEQEALDLFNVIIHEAMSKERACAYLNMSRATFDNWVRLGVIPQGRKRMGWKELCWYRDELDSIVFPK